MVKLDRSLRAELKRHRVGIETPDGDTVILRQVPVNAEFFNKPRTNLLIKRIREGAPFLVCIDEDLKYSGPDAVVARTFLGGFRQKGWRALVFEQDFQSDFQTVIERALSALGSRGEVPVIETGGGTVEQPQRRPSLLARFGIDLSQQVQEGNLQSTVHREREIEDVASCMIRWSEVRMALIAGLSGVGKSNLLGGVARKLAECRPELELISVDLSGLFAGALFDAERENLLSGLLDELAESAKTIVALERLGLALRSVPKGLLLLTQALDRGARLIGTTLPDYLPSLIRAPLERRVQVVVLAEPAGGESLDMVMAARERMESHYDFLIDKDLARAAVAASERLPGHLPAKAIALLDAAAARAALAGADAIGLDDIYFAASRSSRAQDLEHT